MLTVIGTSDRIIENKTIGDPTPMPLTPVLTLRDDTGHIYDVCTDGDGGHHLLYCGTGGEPVAKEAA